MDVPRSDALQPTLVGGLLAGKRVRAAAGGWRHSLAVDSEGCLYSWGWNMVRRKPCTEPSCLVRDSRGREHAGACVSAPTQIL